MAWGKRGRGEQQGQVRVAGWGGELGMGQFLQWLRRMVLGAVLGSGRLSPYDSHTSVT